jgi:adenine-specific DNA-methyltransferase
MAKASLKKTVESLKHDEAKRKNIPTAEYQSVVQKDQETPRTVKYPRNTDLDPQLMWRGKDQQDWSDLVVQVPPLYIQEKVHPKVLIDDLLRASIDHSHDNGTMTPDLFTDFNGIPKNVDKTEFYQHDQNWSNRMILGDSLQVMASLAEREGLRGKVQCIYLDPPYGIKFNSNFQWSTTSRDVKDGKNDHITREPEQVKAFRDTWRDGVHSYLTYLRDRLTVVRDLLAESGSVFVQIGDENVHRVRAVLDEVFGDANFKGLITVEKTSAQTSEHLSMSTDYILFYAKSAEHIKFRDVFVAKSPTESIMSEYSNAEDESLNRSAIGKVSGPTEWMEIEAKTRLFAKDNTTSSRPPGSFPVSFRGRSYLPGNAYWKTGELGFSRLIKANRIETRGSALRYVRFYRDYSVSQIHNIWEDVKFSSRREEKVYVVQSSVMLIQRCMLMTTDPGDLILDPTCGSGTTAYVAEQWGRRWITIDTSRVALTLARARIMGARYAFYLLADSRDGQLKEAEMTRTTPSSHAVHGNIRHGFVYERVPHITLKSIANNAEIDVIWEQWQGIMEPLRKELNAALNKQWQESEIPREAGEPWPSVSRSLFYELQAEQVKGVEARPRKITDCLLAINTNLRRVYTIDTLPERPVDPWAANATKLHKDWWDTRIARQKEIDASIFAKAAFEYLYDKPYDDKKKVRVAGPFTVESLSPHRVLGVDENDELIDTMAQSDAEHSAKQSFPQMILENLKIAGVHQAHKEDRITFTALIPWPGDLVCAEGRYMEGDTEKRAAIFIGPEFGTVQRADLVAAARESGDAGFDVLIACAFNYEAHATEFSKLGRLPVLKARMNADLHMADDLKSTSKGNLFVVFGEPDITLLPDQNGKLRVRVNGVDVFKPQTGEVISDNADGIACWLVDTDYNEESFFVAPCLLPWLQRPYTALKTTLKAEIDPEAWATLHSDTSRPFDRPANGRIAVKVINHLGDEVMKVFRV